MKRMLMISSVVSMIDQFNMENIRYLQSIGYKVDVATNFQKGSATSEERINEFKKELKALDITYYNIEFSRNSLDFNNHWRAYRQLKKIMTENRYDFLHCHSPIGGALGRLVAKQLKVPVIYTAHGFHFYKGAKPHHWLLFYSIERYLANFTDILITINKEDYQRAKSFNTTELRYVPGVGVDIDKFGNVTSDPTVMRRKIGIKNEDFMLLSIGELNKNKNHSVIIRALARLKNPKLQYVICGQGDLLEPLKQLVSQLQLDNQVHFLGFRNDIWEIYNCADVFVFPSFREGLPVSVMEAMASGLPIISSEIRGNVDLVHEGRGGLHVNPRNEEGFAKAIRLLYHHPSLRKDMSEYNMELIKYFSIEAVMEDMQGIYQSFETINNDRKE